jgi:hypothetical protein
VPKAKTLTYSIKVEGVRETLAAFRGLDKEANQAIRDHAQVLAGRFAVKAKAAGAARGRQAALVASTVKPGRDRVPVVTAGGARRLGRRKAPAWALLFGAEFGSNRFAQFGHAHTGRKGIWFFPTIEASASMILKEWQAAADDIVRAFTRGGGE